MFNFIWVFSGVSLQKKTEIILPEHPEIKEHGECMLRLGCDYNILVETPNRDYNASIDYSVNGKHL